ncbi:phage protein Gp37 [Pseudomonas huaxiensis]|uniref:phage protein Gp37 n=1 Tax=Pseudomonas huaxiensis TaxID=2213017 RepID=UPI000DA65A49|nr:phage protein Gp37 [Pseudomonas huaxiensis]
MLGELEDAIQARLGELKSQLRRLHIDSYGGELSDDDLLVDLLKNTPSVLITTPKVVFKPRSHRRYTASVVFRLVISSTSVRGERETRRGSGSVASDPGSYWIWESCMRLLTNWQHKPDGAQMRPTEFANLINGKFQSGHLSVLGQSFAVEMDWDVPEGELPWLEGVDLAYHVPAGNPAPTVTDSVDLGDQ